MQSNKEIVGRIAFLMRELNMKQIMFAATIGIDNSNLSKIMHEKLQVSDALINRIVVSLDVNKRWLTDGEGLPFIKARAGMRNVKQNVGDAPLDESLPIYDLDITATTDPDFENERIIGWINLPELSNKDCRIVRVSGESMSPIVRDGDLVSVRSVSRDGTIFWGQIYVVMLDDYCMVKYVRKHPDPDYVVLNSANKAYDDVEVRRDEIRGLLLVQHIIHVDTRF